MGYSPNEGYDMKARLEVTIGNMRLKSPVMVASGTFGYAEEFRDFLPLKKLGAIVTKTVTLQPRAGNPAPRTCETPAGMLNSIGLQNPGLDAFIEQKLPFLKKTGVPVIMSIASEKSPDEFLVMARRLESVETIVALELNISCPNVRSDAHGNPVKASALISQDPRATYRVVKSIRAVTKKTLITKLSPNVTDIAEIAAAAQEAGSDAVSLINTISGMSIDVYTRRPKIAAGSGGLSGPAIRPVAVRMVREVYQKIKIPIIGMGGIIDTVSALEFIIAGATAVSVGTANFINPGVCRDIETGIAGYLRSQKITDINDLRGSLIL